MPTGDPVPRAPATLPPQEGPLSDVLSEPPSQVASKPAGQPRTMTPKSAAITARNNYVSPYRQTPQSRSVSSPAMRANAGNANSPNFKDIVTRFNTKSDEKIPVPTNRIPANTAGAGSMKSRKPQTWKANGVESRKPDTTSKARASSVAPPPVRSKQPARPNSARDSYSAGTNTRSATSSRQARSRRLSTSSSNSSDKANSRLLPPLQTSFTKNPNKRMGYRRSQSAMETHSPSAASMADNESDTSDRKTLHHRRSRSNIESSHSPIGEIQVDADLLRGFAKESSTSPRSGQSGIPVLVGASTGVESPCSSQQPKKKSVTVPITSAHGSRRPPQPSKSPQLSAYISAPLPKTSPPLRSSRGQRLPAAANSTTHASRQRLQPTTSPKDGSYQRGKGRGPLLEEGRRKEPKKKIPELGTVDFAARRARIQNAFTKSLKESNEQAVSRVAPSQNSRDNSSERNATTRTGLTQGRIDEEEEEEEEEEEKSEVETDTRFDQLAEQIMLKIPAPELHQDSHIHVGNIVEGLEDEAKARMQVEEEERESTAWESSSSSRDNGSNEDLSVPLHSDTSEQQIRASEEGATIATEAKPLGQGKDPVASDTTEEAPTEHSPPRPVNRFSQFFMPEQYPYTANKHRSSGLENNRISQSEQSSDDNATSVHPSTTHQLGGAPIAFVTPESPTRPNLLNQVSDMLRSNSVGWSTDSELSNDSPVLRNGRANDNSVATVRLHGSMSTEQRDGVARFDPNFTLSPGEQHETPVLSPMVSTATSDDRRTIASVFSKYDDHGEDVVRSYTEIEVGTPSESFRRHDGYGEEDETELNYEGSHRRLGIPEDDSRSFTSCSEALDSARPPSSMCDHSMAEETEDGWTTSSDFSPDSEDINGPSAQIPESPTTPRQPIGAESPLPPTPPPKDIPPPPPEKDRKPRSISPNTSSAIRPVLASKPSFESGSQRGSALLPEIETDEEPLGLAIQALPSHFDFRPTGDRKSSYNSEHYYTRSSTDYRPNIDSRSSMDHRPSIDHRPSMDQYSINRPSIDQKYSPPSSVSDSRRSSMFASNGHRYSETTIPSMNTTLVERGSSSIHSLEPKDTPEQKMLKKRRHLLKEIVDTESAFFRDMTVAEEIYKGSANACYSLTPEDVKVLFANTDAIVQFSKGFLEVLKLAVSSVYVMRRGPSGINSSAASVANSVNSDERLDDMLTDEEKDRKTYVGEAFAEVMYRMERVYGDYCKNHDTAVARLGQLESNPGISIWLQECKACAEDLTNAWNLESLLIKPVQRVLKYPLLLSQLLECTPANHPDQAALEIATKEMGFVAGRINEMKKRKDMVEKIVGRKRNESDIRHGISKVFTRRAEKLRQSVGLSEVVVDETFNKLFENYNMHCAQVEVVARDIEIYAADIQSHVDKFINFTSAFKFFGSAVLTAHTQTEEKWKRFDTAMREISTTYLHEHKQRVRKHAIDPLEALLKLHESPQIIMTKRNNKAVDFARYKAIKDRGDTPDKKTKELADAYVALNETLIEELPRLFVLTKKLVDAVLFNFIDLQAQWMNDWASKIKMTFIELDLPMKADDIIHCFAGDFTYNEAMINQLNICNGALNAMQFPSLNSTSSSLLSPSSTTLTLEAFDSSSFRRPKTADDNNLRERAMSLNSQSPTIASFDTSERRHSGGAFSPISPTGSALALPPLLGSNNRIRASSVAVPQRSPVGSAMPPPPAPQRSYSNNISEIHTTSQSTFFNSSERQPRARGGYTAAAPPPLSLSSRRAEAPSPSPPLPSAAFSSAMPMDDDRDRETSNPPSRVASRASSREPSRAELGRTLTVSANDKAIFIAASLYEFKLPSPRREAGFPYLNYVQGEIFDVIGIKGEIWLARNQDDATGEIGWIWCKHFTKLPDN
ncbi:hypothetical protein K440DRAFT_657945 [Wilcoxina mikolae CBS 423.85]|nr:hypothetical protein K440DRAFT_657945 [Wilcoxina mikolae CBS 423.85]